VRADRRIDLSLRACALQVTRLTSDCGANTTGCRLEFELKEDQRDSAATM